MLVLIDQMRLRLSSSSDKREVKGPNGTQDDLILCSLNAILFYDESSHLT